MAGTLSLRLLTLQQINRVQNAFWGRTLGSIASKKPQSSRMMCSLHSSSETGLSSHDGVWSLQRQSAACFHSSAVQQAKKGKKHKPKVDVEMSADEDILNLEELKKDLQKAIDALKEDYTKSLSIRTSQGALDHIMVSTPDGRFPLNQLGQITTKSANLITVNLSGFPQVTEAAAKALSSSGMNLNPKVEGNIIQVPIPKVTKEHRENLAKSAKGMCDKAKVSLRSTRSKYVSMVKKHKEGTSKDTVFRLEKQIQQVMDTYSETAEHLLAAKTKELLGKS